MALGHRPSWKITIHGKICNIYIKLKAIVKLPSGNNFQRILNLDKLLIQVDSKSESQILVQRRRTLKSRILCFVKKHFRRRRSKTSSGFKMPKSSRSLPYLVLETQLQSCSHLSRLELISRVASFCGGFGLGSYLIWEFGPALKREMFALIAAA